MRRRLAFSLASLLFTSSGVASANGRYPFTQQLVVSPADPARLWLRATYGFLTSADSGGSWSWVCEQAIGYQGLQDPMLGVTREGTVLAGLFEGLSVTRDQGCTWAFAPAVLEHRYVVDLAVEHGDPARALVISSSGRDGGGFENLLWRSTDSGASFAVVGAELDPDLLLVTVDPAPSLPTRIYVSALGNPTPALVADGGAGDAGTTDAGTTDASSTDAGTTDAGTTDAGTTDASAADASSTDAGTTDASSTDGGDAGDAASDARSDGPAPDPVGLLLVSDDGGRTWARRVVPTSSLSEPPFIAAVHPSNPDEIYVRVNGFTADWLLRSRDAGRTWSELLRVEAHFGGFALSPDGSTVLAGFGDPHVQGEDYPKENFGIYAASTAPEAPAFDKIFDGTIGCLTWTGDAVYACGSRFVQGFDVGVSRDGAHHFDGLMSTTELTGASECVAGQCQAQWVDPNNGLCTRLGACDDAGTADAGPTRATTSGDESKCSCRAPGTPRFQSAWISGLAVAGLLVNWRRRARFR